MSLYIGKLSRWTHRDDLERVFSRFGRCNVRMKDGYGFVVYDNPPNAEKALGALQGRSICGERLTITWSNKQPKPFPRFARGGARSYELQRGRNSSRRGDYGRRDYSMNMNEPDNDDGRHTSADMLDEVGSYHQENFKDYAREEHHDYRDSLTNEGGNVESALVENGRWGDQVRDKSNDYGVENDVELERYERYRHNEMKDHYENRQMAYTGRSPSPGSPQEKIEREQIGEVSLGSLNDSKTKGRCFYCGETGHIKRYCPRRNASQRKFTRFDRVQGNEIHKEGRSELRSSKDTSMMHLKNEREISGLRKREILIKSGSSPRRKETDRDWTKNYERKKRSGREIRISEGHSSKRARRSVSSPLHSNHTASRSHSTSQLSKSLRRSSRSRSRSRSASSRTHSTSSISRSSSTSHGSGSRIPKSRSRSSSHASLSASADRSLPPPPDKVQLNLKDSLDNATTPESRKILVKQGELVEGDLGSHNAKLDATVVSVNDENTPTPFKIEGDVGMEQPMRRMSESSYEVTNPCTLHTEKGVLANGILSPTSLLETRELQVSSELAAEHMLTPFKKPDSETPFSSHTHNSTSLSSGELHMVLKHYGLALPEENEQHLTVEDYFGSSRLWPWEIIYYRRLKKGPISNENYARRLAQNREFGIIDKYIRSSSGWGESSQDGLEEVVC